MTLLIFLRRDRLFESWDMILLPVIVFFALVLIIIRLSFLIRLGLFIASFVLTIMFAYVLVYLEFFKEEAMLSLTLPFVIYLVILLVLNLIHIVVKHLQ